jgi:hypothetical protein
MLLKMMKGFEIRHNDKTTKVAVEDGMVMIHLFDNNADSRIYVGGVDYEKRERIVWCNLSPMEIGDKFEIKFVEIDDTSMPVKIEEDENIKRPKTKLEFFRELEAKLKQEGLI